MTLTLSLSRRWRHVVFVVMVLFAFWSTIIVICMQELDQVSSSSSSSLSSSGDSSLSLPPPQPPGGKDSAPSLAPASSLASSSGAASQVSSSRSGSSSDRARPQLRHQHQQYQSAPSSSTLSPQRATAPTILQTQDNSDSGDHNQNHNNPNSNSNSSLQVLLTQPRGQLFPHRVLHALTYGSVLNGRFRTPLVMLEMRLEGSLHQHFLHHQHMFACNQSELDKLPSLDRRVKLPVYIYEGYFHTMPASSHIYSRNPNPLIGVDFMKPPASDFVRAFYVAFRRVNRHILRPLQEALFASARSRNPQQPERDVCYLLASWIQQDKVFSDLSIQIHYGEGNAQNFPHGWHVDAENSLLHLAVTLRGSRVLHSRRCAADHGPAEEVLQPQGPGDVYLSSSALMLHAPRFSYASYEDRVIALHARILYTTQELTLFRKYRTEESWKSLTHILSDTLSRADVQLPSLAQVQRISAEELQLTPPLAT